MALNHVGPVPVAKDNVALLRQDDVCIRCGLCNTTCTNEVAVGGMYDQQKTSTPLCVHCGQCINVCPVNALTEVYEYPHVQQALANPDQIVVVNTSPAVRVAIGEAFGGQPGAYSEGKMVAALHALGFDYVLDTTFSADLTIMEEAHELIQRITRKTKPLPQFTSCCPAWVKFVELFYPHLLPNLSTAKSPIGMQGPTVKTYFAKKMGLDPLKIVNVALTPCTAKKFEIRRDEMHAAGDYWHSDTMRDMDFVLTTRELALLLKEAHLDWDSLPEADYDNLLGRGSGAGIIFGNTGGVMEAAVRTAYFAMTGQQPPAFLYHLEPFRGLDGVKQASFEIGGTLLRIGVVHGLANAKALLEKMESGQVELDFVEVMTCRGGCVGGGGQPKTSVPPSDEVRNRRIQGLYQQDASMDLRLCHENPEIKKVYQEFYGAPLSELAEKLLHTKYYPRGL